MLSLEDMQRLIDAELARAKELAEQRYPNHGRPGERDLARRAFIEGYHSGAHEERVRKSNEQ